MTRNRCTHAHIDADVAVGDAAGRRTERRPAESYGAVVAYKRRKMRQFEGRTANARKKKTLGKTETNFTGLFYLKRKALEIETPWN